MVAGVANELLDESNLSPVESSSASVDVTEADS